VVYISIAPPERTKMGQQRRLGIYVRFESSSIIKYLKQLTINVLTAHFIDCQSGQTILREKQMLRKQEILWNASSLTPPFYHHTNQC
jgi:hypothetical protein